MKKILINNWAFILILILGFSISWPLSLPGYFSHHDDLQVMRIFEMRHCLTDLQIPCRWVPDMGFGNGFPLFNYYNVLPYYIGAISSFILSYIWAAKFIFFIPLILGGISMYLLGKELFGKSAGLVAATLFLLAPYRALGLYVRGAVAESFALAIIPLVFYFILKLIREKKFNNFLGVSLSFGAFLISHNILAVFFVPVIFLWSAYFIYLEKSKNVKSLIISLIIGFGLSAFFIIPAYFEKSLVQTENLIRMNLDYRANFATIVQLFLSRFWGYNVISPQIGWPHWWLVIISILIVGAKIVMHKLNFKQIKIFVLLLIIFLTSVFMAHNKSTFIWERIDILKYAQFPWRFLSMVIFSASLIGGFLITLFQSDRQKRLIIVIIIAGTILLNWNYFRPERFYLNLTDEEKLSGFLWEEQQKAAILDYLPTTATEPKERAPQKPILVSGDAQINNFVNHTNKWSFEANVTNPSKVELPVFDFPDWQVKVNGKEYPHDHLNLLGRISINLPSGTYKVEGFFNNTPIRSVANVITLISIALLLILSFYGKSKKIIF